MIPKATIWIFLEKVIRLPLSYLTLIYTSRLFSPADFGAYTLAVAISSFLFTITDLGLSQSLLALSSYTKYQQKELIWATIYLKLSSNVVVSIILLIACILRYESITLRVLFILSLTNLLLTLPTSVRQYVLDKKYYAALASSDIVSSWSFQFFKYIFAFLGFSVVFQAIAQLISVILQTAVLRFSAFRRSFSIKSVSLSAFKLAIYRSREYFFSSVVVFLYVKADQVALASMHGNASLAPYSLSVMVIESTMVLYPVITSIFSASLGSRNARHVQHSIIKMNACLYLVAVAVFIITILFAVFLVPFLYSSKYPDLQANILILSPCMLITAVTSSLMLQFQHEGRRKEIFFANMLTAVASVLISLPMIYLHKSIGASIATTLSSAALPLVLIYFTIFSSGTNLKRLSFLS